MEATYYGLSIDQWINITIASATIFTLICTIVILRESTKMREMYITPEISMYLHFGEASPTIMFMSIENIGLGTACDVSFNILRNYGFYKYDHDRLENRGIFRNGMSNIYPKQKFRYYINDLSENHEEKMKESLRIEVQFRDVTNKFYTKIFNLKIEEYLGGSKFTPPESYVGRISYELEEIKKLYKKDLESRSEPRE